MVSKLKQLAESSHEEDVVKMVNSSIWWDEDWRDFKLMDAINNISVLDLLKLHIPCLELASDWKNFVGCNNDQYKWMYYVKEKNIIMYGWTHYIKNACKWYWPYHFVLHHFCDWDSQKTIKWFYEKYPHIKKYDKALLYRKEKTEPEIKDEDIGIIEYWQQTKEFIQERRKININNICRYWTKILDDYLWWILDSELVIIAAETWVWKTDFWLSCAIANALRWKKILFLLLEWDLSELSARYMQKSINQTLPIWETLRTKDYRFNLVDICEIEDKVFDELDERIKKNIFLFNKKVIPDIQIVKKLIEKYKDDVDMIIIDHLHYIDLGNIEQENLAIWKIMRSLKTLTDIIHKPILMMSHFRKRPPTRSKKKDLEIDDLYWSSNVSKEATSILFLENKELCENGFWDEFKLLKNNNENNYSLTQIRLVKSRIGLPVPTTFHLIYDRAIKSYMDNFQKIITDNLRWMTEEDIIKDVRKEFDDIKI